MVLYIMKNHFYIKTHYEQFLPVLDLYITRIVIPNIIADTYTYMQ